MHNDDCNSNVKIITKQKESNENWSYFNCVAKFEKYFDVANRNNDIKNILNETLDKLSSIEYQAGVDQEVKPPNSLLVPGCRFSFPRRNVEIGGARRKRKVYK